jgi:hypothetical protein
VENIGWLLLGESSVGITLNGSLFRFFVLDLFFEIWREEGIASFYRGIVPPLLQVGAPKQGLLEALVRSFWVSVPKNRLASVG